MFLFISLLPLTTKLDKGPEKLYLFENGRQNFESIRNALNHHYELQGIDGPVFQILMH